MLTPLLVFLYFLLSQTLRRLLLEKKAVNAAPCMDRPPQQPHSWSTWKIISTSKGISIVPEDTLAYSLL